MRPAVEAELERILTGDDPALAASRRALRFLASRLSAGELDDNELSDLVTSRADEFERAAREASLGDVEPDELAKSLQEKVVSLVREAQLEEVDAASRTLRNRQAGSYAPISPLALAFGLLLLLLL